MLDAPKFEDNYDGSRTFTWLANLCGLSVDLVNLLICQFLALFLASLFRSILHPSKVSSSIRHVFALSIGLAFGYFCFGQEAIHIALLPAVCYVVIRTQNPAVVQKTVIIVAMSYLLSVHLIRQIYDYGSYSLDITGPLMIITQKVTSLAFNIHDGFIREKEDLTKAQQYHAVQKLPSALEYFSYVLHFQGILVGPLVFYKDYIEFIDGRNLLKNPGTNGNFDNGKSELVIEPSPTKSVIKKVIGSLVCAMIFMKFVKIYPIKHMNDDDFVEGTSIAYKYWYAMMATTCTRFKYYHAWLLADAICNNSGLGFTGYDKDGNPKWDLISNINVLSFEFASNMRDAINNWNIGTNRWLRTIVYERVPKKYGTVLTFALSAVWHGFYPGYYVTFATGAVMVTAGRCARRMFRYRFQGTQFTRMFYDILTCATTRLFLGYTTYPFVLLEFMGSIRVYLKLYMCLHLVAIFTIFVLPKYISGEKRPTTNKTTLSESTALSTTSIDDLSSSTTTTISSSLASEHSIHKSHHIYDLSTSSTNLNIPPMGTDENGKDMDMVAGKNRRPILSDNNKVGKDVDVTTTLTTNTTASHVKNLGPPMERKQQQSVVVACAREAVSVKHDQCEMDNLSNKIKEKIDMETKNIEEFIDKTVNETVTGIVGFKNDLMRDSDKLFISKDGIRKRASATGDKLSPTSVADGVDAFIKKEIDAINAVVQQANVLPAVLSNGHAK